MEIEEYINKKKEFYDCFHQYIENDGEIEYSQVIKYFQLPKVQESREELKSILQFLIKVSNNHHRSQDFINKITKIIIDINSDIKQQFSNIEIFDLFKSNKYILLFLIDQNIITIDETMTNLILEIGDSKYTKYCHFFYPEIKKFLDERTKTEIENELLNIDPDIFEKFIEKRSIGENHSYITNLMRNDSVEEFISYTSRNQISPSSIIESSIFETNLFLLKNHPTLIEYSAFFGSIQIFQYLSLNNAKLTSLLWFYVIHSQNAELIHILEENSVEPDDKSYKNCLKESIKCHHNEIANYIINTFMNENELNDSLIDYSLHYYNYYYMSFNYNDDYKSFLSYSYLHDQFKFVNLLLKEKSITISEKLILNNYDLLIKFFFISFSYEISFLKICLNDVLI